MKIVSLEEQSFKVHSSHTPTFFIPDPPFGKRNHIILELQTTSFFINGCLNWMIPNQYIKITGCFTKHPLKKAGTTRCWEKKQHPLKNGCLGYQDLIRSFHFLQLRSSGRGIRFPTSLMFCLFFFKKMLIEKLGITWGY